MSCSGSFSVKELKNARCLLSSDADIYYTSTGVKFNANTNINNYGNPMSGHANGEDIHPYSVKFLPILVY